MFAEIGSGQIAIWAGYTLTFFSTFFVMRKLLQEEEARAAQENLEDQRSRQSSNALVRLTRPIFSQYVVPFVKNKPFWEVRRKAYRRKLISAGLSDELTSDEAIALKLFLIILFPIIGGLLNALDIVDVSGPMIFVLMVAGWVYPDIWLHFRITRRHKDILKSMPFIIDLLALSTEAGLDFMGAIGKVVEKANPSPLVDELEQLLKEIKVGSSRADAMQEMASRINMTEINSFIAILISADSMGASIGKVLRQQSEQIRVERFVRAEKAGATAQMKLMAPLFLCYVPAVFLMIFGPIAISVMSTGLY